jgi:Pyridoxamine 5'-phosphate oxidase
MKLIPISMESLTSRAFTRHMTTNPYPTNPVLTDVLRAIEKRSFFTLATSSPTRQPHVAGVMYALADDRFYITTSRTSRKARNIAANPNVFVCIPIRRAPVGPPSTVQFAGTAELLTAGDPDVVALVQAGRLKAITRHGELEMADVSVVRITPSRRLLTYGLGLPLRQLIKDPLNAAGVVNWN